MNLETFRATLGEAAQPPTDLGLPLQALWWDGKGDWTAAHDALQNDSSPAGSWVHAYLHRKEGDASNAAHWYRRAGKPVAAGALDAEWQLITEDLLSAQ